MMNQGLRQIIDLAVETGRKWQSEQTRFVHYCYHLDKTDHHDTIPTYENLLFVLALFRSHKTENVEEARLILERLLGYQGESTSQGPGNFPVYLHEYPRYYNRWHGAKLLAPFYWILKKFDFALGSELKGKTIEAATRLQSYCLETLKIHSADYLTTLQIAATAKALGTWLDHKEFVSEGERLIHDLDLQGPQPCWYSTKGLEEILVCFQMTQEDSLKSFCQHLIAMWHTPTHSYAGPVMSELQLGYESKPTLYDLFMATYTDHLPKRCRVHHPYHLQGVLIQPAMHQVRSAVPVDLGGEIEARKWKMYGTEDYVYSLIEQSEVLSEQTKGFHPLRLLWSNNENLFSLVGQGGRASEIKHHANKDHISLLYTLEEPVASHHPVENREIMLFCSAQDGVKVKVEGKPATLFQLGETIQIESSLNVSLRFDLEEGDGDFVGHIMPANRPSQKLISKNKPTQAYDWAILLRGIRKASSCKVRVIIDIQTDKC